MSITASIDTKDYPEIEKIFGYSKLTLTATIKGNDFTLDHKIEGTGRIGLHPWVRANDSNTIQGEILQEYVLEDMVPTSLKEVDSGRDISEERKLSELALDHVFKPEIQKDGFWSVKLRDEENNRTVEFKGDGGYSDVVLWNGWQGSVSVEPGNIKENSNKKGRFIIRVTKDSAMTAKITREEYGLILKDRVFSMDVEQQQAETAPGGILFDPAMIKMTIERDDGRVPVRFDYQNLPVIDMNTFEGLYINIINMAPANMPLLLGLDVDSGEEENERELVYGRKFDSV